jgi:hypothetical protein
VPWRAETGNHRPNAIDLRAGEQVSGRDTKATGDPDDGRDPHVAHASLGSAQLDWVHVTALGEGFLRDPLVTLGIYAQAMTASDDDRERLRLLVEGDNLTGDRTRPDRATGEKWLLSQR